MIHSMTGFASQQRESEFGLLSLDLRSLNHRYLEVTIRLPEELRSTEARLRELIGDHLSRGKIDLSVRFRPGAGASGALRLNESFAHSLAELSTGAREFFPEAREPDLAAWMAWPGVVEEVASDLSPLQAELVGCVEQALSELVAYRRREGEKLGAAIRERLAEVGEIADRFRNWMPQIRERQRERLAEKVAGFTETAVDDGRLEQEVALLLQRLDVDEELDRLDAHVSEVDRTLNRDKPIGRRLDFLMQELNREANTLGSKSADPRTSQKSVDLKVLIEQMREQVQNIE